MKPRITLMGTVPNRPRCAWCTHPLDVHGALRLRHRRLQVLDGRERSDDDFANLRTPCSTAHPIASQDSGMPDKVQVEQTGPPPTVSAVRETMAADETQQETGIGFPP